MLSFAKFVAVGNSQIVVDVLPAYRKAVSITSFRNGEAVAKGNWKDIAAIILVYILKEHDCALSGLMAVVDNRYCATTNSSCLTFVPDLCIRASWTQQVNALLLFIKFVADNWLKHLVKITGSISSLSINWPSICLSESLVYYITFRLIIVNCDKLYVHILYIYVFVLF